MIEAESAPIQGEHKEVLLDIAEVSLAFGGVQALSDVSFDIYKGEIRAIIGPNGAGKSSMLNVINGFYHPQKGTIKYKEEVRKKMSPHKAASQGISRTFQNIALFKGMTTLDNIMTGRILKIDEPMAGMNVEEKEDMCRFIIDVNEEFGTTIALIEHDMGVVMDLSDRVVVLNYGRKIADGTPDQVRANQGVIDAYLGVSHSN